jgi:hypothetical protein
MGEAGAQAVRRVEEVKAVRPVGAGVRAGLVAVVEHQVVSVAVEESVGLEG